VIVMRLRNNPNAKAILAQSKYMIKEKQDNYFNNNKPLHLEVGSGKGAFLVGMAQKYPDINFIGVEKFKSVLLKAIKKAEAAQLENLLFLEADATNLAGYFKPNSVECLYLNFSDPWPKPRHYKRRLSYQDFLNIYQTIMQKDGYLKQKTDNRSLFESSLLSYNDYGMKLEMVNLDLHQSEHAKENVQSEYETKFASEGQVIYSVWAKFKEEE
jgi:tRNA (guanine-N7-)-methyltransferase